MEEAGAAAITLHGRTREQRYTKAADWDLIGQLAAERSVPVIGNGDILTYYDATRLRQKAGCAGVMLARGVLIKPWLFQEIAEGRAIEPDAAERVAIYRRLACYMKEHFRDDEKGRNRAMRFLPWHFDFFWRYQPLPEAEYAAVAAEHPLMQTRRRREEGLSTLERVLRDPRAEMHTRIAETLWDATDDADAVARVEAIAEDLPPVDESEWREIATGHG